MIHMTNPKRSGDSAFIKMIRPDGVELWLSAGTNAMRYAKRNQLEVVERAGQFFGTGLPPMAKLFQSCKGRIEAMRKINGMGEAVWNR